MITTTVKHILLVINQSPPLSMPSVDDSIATKGIHPAAQPIHAWRKLLHQATAFTKQYTGNIWGTILEHVNISKMCVP
jgi:hypothetical protein